MKKLLTILSSFAITATGVSTVVACDNDEEKKTGDNTEQPGKVKLDGLAATVTVASEPTVKDFTDKLILALKDGKDAFKALTAADIKVEKKAGGDLAPVDLEAGTIEIKVTGKGEKFEGTKEITVTFTIKTTTPTTEKTSLDGLDATATFTSEGDDVAKFKTALLAVLITKTGFSELQETDFDLLKEDGKTALSAAELATAGEVKIVVKAKGDNFKDQRAITVNWTKGTTGKTSLDGLDATATVTSQDDDVAKFKTALLAVLITKTGFSELKETDFDLFKEDGKTALSAVDLAATGEVKIVVKAKGDNFKDQKAITVNWTKGTATI